MDILQSLPPELATMILATLPITEIRVSIPLAIQVYKLSVPSAIFWSLIGNLGTTAFLMMIIGPVSKFLSQNSKWLAKFFDWLFERTRRKFYTKYSKYGDVALVLFVAIPLPSTGCWTGAIAAWLFGIAPRKAFILISLGVFISALVITLISLGVFQLV
jgi:uncharacterized membrane protein